MAEPSERELILAALSLTYTAEGCEVWLRSRNRNLAGYPPIVLLREGRADEVWRDVERLDGVTRAEALAMLAGQHEGPPPGGAP